MQVQQAPLPAPPVDRRTLRINWTLVAGVALALLLAIGLRIVALSSDPDPHLDWSAGQLTDEGFYIHNARSAALFGHPRTDEFNNMLLAPLLHFTQLAVFKLFGVGSVQARSISVVCSLLSLLLFWAALRRAFDGRIALTAALFLALDHTYLLFNRMALMDTPAALGAVAAFYVFVRAMDHDGAARSRRLIATGALLALTIINRSLCAYLLPAPFVALWPSRTRKADLKALCIGLGLVFAVYAVVWYWPNRQELSHMTRFYRTVQIQPHSLGHLFENIDHALFGDYRGLAPYLFRHTPVLFVLAILGMAFGRQITDKETRRQGDKQTTFAPSPRRPVAASVLFLSVWLALGWAMLAVISYSPSRYYVTTYPAMAALAAVALWRLPAIDRALPTADGRARAMRACLAWLLAYHLAESIVHHQGVVPPLATWLILYVPATLLAIAAAIYPGARATPTHTPTLVTALLTAWLIVNAGWLGDWALHLGYTQKDAARWLATNLPPDSVVFGDPAPGMCLDNALLAVPVFPLLDNFKEPLEKFAGRPRYITFVLDSPLRRKYWRKCYPGCDAPDRLVGVLHVLRWDVGVYRFDSSIHYVEPPKKEKR